MLTILNKQKKNEFNAINKKLNNLLISSKSKEYNQQLDALKHNHNFYPKFIICLPLNSLKTKQQLQKADKINLKNGNKQVIENVIAKTEDAVNNIDQGKQDTIRTEASTECNNKNQTIINNKQQELYKTQRRAVQGLSLIHI